MGIYIFVYAAAYISVCISTDVCVCVRVAIFSRKNTDPTAKFEFQLNIKEFF